MSMLSSIGHELWAWAHGVPPIVWSGVFGATIAALISYFGVRAANKSSLDRLHAQHKFDSAEAVAQRAHDGRQKEEDRKAAIRREVYGKAVEEVHAVLAYIGGLPERPLWKGNDDEGLQLFLKANAKVWLVAESDAALLSRELASLVSEYFFKALSAARPFREAMEPIRQLEERIKVEKAEDRRIRTKFSEAREASAAAETLETLLASGNNTKELIQLLEGERLRQLAALRPQRYSAFNATAREMQAVQLWIVKLVSSLRRELQLDPAEAAFMAQFDDMHRRAMASVDRAFAPISQKLTDD
jgi:hypothetical protein